MPFRLSCQSHSMLTLQTVLFAQIHCVFLICYTCSTCSLLLAQVPNGLLASTGRILFVNASRMLAQHTSQPATIHAKYSQVDCSTHKRLNLQPQNDDIKPPGFKGVPLTPSYERLDQLARISPKAGEAELDCGIFYGSACRLFSARLLRS